MKKSKLLLAAPLVVLVAGLPIQRVHSASPTFTDANWVSMGALPGADDEVLAAVTDSAGNLYIGGKFKVVGSVVANGIAKWDGTNWSALGAGMSMETLSAFGWRASVNALVFIGNDLYAAGRFLSAGGVAATNIAKWNGTSWSTLNSGIDSLDEVQALAASGNDLYVGGRFPKAGGLLVNNIAKWNAASGWSALGSGMDLDPGWVVKCLAVSGGSLYAGGYFDSAGGVPASCIAKWNGSSWSALGEGLNGTVWSLAFWGTDLYAGGYFTYSGAIEANRIAKWDGNAWSALGAGLSPDSTWVTDLAVANGILYVGGNFSGAGGVGANGFAQWNGTSWANAYLREVGAMAFHGNQLFAAGRAISGGGYHFEIATQTGGPWSFLGGGSSASPLLDGPVFASAVSGSNLYVGGAFTTAGGLPVNHIAKWDGASWSPLGDGVNNWVYALKVHGGDLYAGGSFTSAGGIPTPGVARWNGTDWSPLGEPSVGEWTIIWDLAVSDGNVFAGGQFDRIGGVAANHIARWNGTNWSALGAGVEWAFDAVPPVYRLVLMGNDLYAAGGFVNAGGITANRIAKWDGNTWSSLGGGMDRMVTALAVSGNEVFAGGFFSTAGGDPASGIAKWNGTSWESLGAGVNGFVNDMTVSGGELYVVGNFDFAGGKPVHGIAKWNPATGWSSFGSGLVGSDYYGVTFGANDVEVVGSDLFVGGSFGTAGDKASAYLARAYLVAPPGGIADSITASSGTATINFYGNPGHQFDVLRATNLTPPVAWTKLNVSPLSPATNGVFSFTDFSAPGSRAYYRSQEK